MQDPPRTNSATTPDPPPEVVWETKSLPPAKQPLLWVLVAVCLGAVVDRYLLSLPVIAWGSGCVLALVTWFLLWRFARSGIAVGFVLLAAAMLMAGWHHAHWHYFCADDIGLFAQAEKEPACVEAIVTSSVQIVRVEGDDPMQIIPQTDRSVVELQLVRIRDVDHWTTATGNARLTVSGHLLGVEAGDRVRVVGKLRRPPTPRNPGQRDAATYHRADRRLARLHASFPESVSVLKPDGKSDAKRPGVGWFAQLRSKASRLFAHHLDPRSAGLASAMLLGSRGELDSELKSAFIETGTMHLLAISGLHVGLLAWFLFFTMQTFRVSPAKSAIFVALVILFYAMLVDARPPVIRATILVWVFCLGQIYRRDMPAFNSLAAAGLVVMVLNPTSLFQVGAQLSFLAVGAILWFTPMLNRTLRDKLSTHPYAVEEKVSWRGLLFWLDRSSRQLILISLTIWLITAPLVMARFHVLSPLGPLLNVVLWIPVTIALASGFLFLVLGALCPPLAVPLAWLVNETFHLIDLIVSSTAEIPYSHFWVAGPSDWWLLGFYLLLCVGLFLPRRLGKPRWPKFAPLTWIGVGLFVAAMSGTPGELRATFISVGHGSCTLVQTPSGKNFLCDCGCLTSGRYGADTISRVLWDHGVPRLDGVFLSHADADHYNALPGLLERFSVKTVYVPPQMFLEEPDSQAIAALHQAIEKANIPIREIQAGDLLRLDEGCQMEVLHPAKRYALESNNANSLVLLIEYEDRRMLLPGDLQASGINTILAEEPIDCDVLLVPHHGSRNSKPAELAQWCQPEHAIISNGPGRSLSETTTAYSNHNADVYQTCKDGAIEVSLSRHSVSATRFAACREEIEGKEPRPVVGDIVTQR